MRSTPGVLLVLVLSCGNPALNRYLVYENPDAPQSDTTHLKNGLELKKSPRVVLQPAKEEDLDNLAESLGIAIEQKYYRLPPVSIFRLHLENNTSTEQTFDFSDCEFQNDLKEKFPVVTRRSYEARFTSTAYQRFPYNAIYSFYFTRHPEKKQKAFGPYVARILPDEVLELPPDSEGQVYVPFELLTIGSRRYTLECPSARIRQNFYYRTIRADREK